MGFAHTYYLAGVFHAKLPSLLVHLRGALFSCWILLLIAQIMLVSVGRVDWHMRLGLLGMTFAGLMVFVGFATIIGAVRRHSAPGMSTEGLFAVDVLQLTVFAILVSWALAVRRDGAAHKRLMILATVALLGPAVSRWPYDFVFSSDLRILRYARLVPDFHDRVRPLFAQKGSYCNDFGILPNPCYGLCDAPHGSLDAVASIHHVGAKPVIVASIEQSHILVSRVTGH